MAKKNPVWSPCPYDFVEIEWDDAQTHAEWHDHGELEDIDDTPICYSRGWLIKDQKNAYAVAASFIIADGKIEQTGTIDVIPKGMVRKLTVIEPKGKIRE